jgi:hypothetical protein
VFRAHAGRGPAQHPRRDADLLASLSSCRTPSRCVSRSVAGARGVELGWRAGACARRLSALTFMSDSSPGLPASSGPCSWGLTADLQGRWGNTCRTAPGMRCSMESDRVGWLLLICTAGVFRLAVLARRHVYRPGPLRFVDRRRLPARCPPQSWDGVRVPPCSSDRTTLVRPFSSNYPGEQAERARRRRGARL